MIELNISKYLAAAIMKKKGYILLSEIKALPAVDDESAEEIISYLGNGLKAKSEAVIVDQNSTIPYWDVSFSE